MKHVVVGILCLIMVACSGGLVFFNLEDSNTMKMSMQTFKKQSKLIKQWTRSDIISDDDAVNAADIIFQEMTHVKSVPVKKSNNVFDEKFGKGVDLSQKILEFVQQGDKKKARKTLKKLKHNCLACHTKLWVIAVFD